MYGPLKRCPCELMIIVAAVRSALESADFGIEGVLGELIPVLMPHTPNMIYQMQGHIFAIISSLIWICTRLTRASEHLGLVTACGFPHQRRINHRGPPGREFIYGDYPPPRKLSQFQLKEFDIVKMLLYSVLTALCFALQSVAVSAEKPNSFIQGDRRDALQNVVSHVKFQGHVLS